MLETYMHYIDRYAAKAATSHVGTRDQYYDAILDRVIYAVKTYDAGRGTKVNSWLYSNVKWAISRVNKVIQRERDKGGHVVLELDSLEFEIAVAPAEDDWIETHRQKLRAAMVVLHPQEHKVVMARLEGYKYSEIGKVMGVTKQRAYQHWINALGKIREYVGDGVDSYQRHDIL
jgi:RNA polymerase sigma factor (sigma-70 family)